MSKKRHLYSIRYCTEIYMDSIENLEKRIAVIEERNRRVEAEKAWETSVMRTLSLSAATYIIAGIFMQSVHLSYPWLNAFVPTLGYYLSTRSLPFVKRWWMRRRNK